MLAQTGTVAHCNRPQHGRPNANTHAVAKQYMARSVINQRKTFNGCKGTNLKPVPRKHVHARAAANNRTLATLVKKRVYKYAYPPPRAGVAAWCNAPMHYLLQLWVRFYFCYDAHAIAVSSTFSKSHTAIYDLGFTNYDLLID